MVVWVFFRCERNFTSTLDETNQEKRIQLSMSDQTVDDKTLLGDYEEKPDIWASAVRMETASCEFPIGRIVGSNKNDDVSFPRGVSLAPCPRRDISTER